MAQETRTTLVWTPSPRGASTVQFSRNLRISVRSEAAGFYWEVPQKTETSWTTLQICAFEVPEAIPSLQLCWAGGGQEQKLSGSHFGKMVTRSGQEETRTAILAPDSFLYEALRRSFCEYILAEGFRKWVYRRRFPPEPALYSCCS